MTKPLRPEAKPWHALAADDSLQAMNSRREGLSSEEARARLEKHGPNELPGSPPTSIAVIIARQFKSPLIYILLLAAILSVAVGDVSDASFIAIVLAVNALIGGYQEWKAEKSSRALQKLLQVRASVIRGGDTSDIDAREIVPGDICFLESGFRVPADLRLLSANGLEIDESLLTGESVAVHKDMLWIGAPETPVADRRNMAFAGSVVARGRGLGLVVSTGNETMVGELATGVAAAGPPSTPLMERMERFSRAVAIGVVGAALLIGALGVLIHQYGVLEMVMFGVALAVSAIPEGLPITITIALAVAARRMAHRGVIIRRLAAVEGLGSCTMIASDKTGTLTTNEITATEIRLPHGETLTVTGRGFDPAGEVEAGGHALRAVPAHLRTLGAAAVLCNEADLHPHGSDWKWRGDPTEIALLSLGHKIGCTKDSLLAEFPQVNAIPFEAENKFAATFHQTPGGITVFVKGAPERVLDMCRMGDDEQTERFHRDSHEMAARGFRVLALASGSGPKDLTAEQTPPVPANLTFLGLVGMIDPLRSGVTESVATCHRAGIKVCMVTGDHPVTALAIAKELGLAERPDQLITGPEFSAKSGADLHEAINRVRVFARMAPDQKLTLVQGARDMGHFVAVTGDGVNDAPALSAANIGVAMGKAGTDVARESSELVISDDNFNTIVAGIEEGRVAYDNIRKVIFLLVATGAAEVLLLGAAVITGLPLPLLPAQILWLNLVTNGIQDKPLAIEPAEGDVLLRKPRRPNESVFNRLMIERIAVLAGTVATIGYAAFYWMIQNGWSEDSARNSLLLMLVLAETMTLGAARSETSYSLTQSPLKNPLLIAAALTAIVVHLAAMHIPITQRVLALSPVTPKAFFVFAGLAATVFVVSEIHKWTWRKRYPIGH